MNSLLIWLLVATTFPEQALTEPTWLTNITQAQEQATKDQQKILLVFSGSDWCKPCIRMEQEVFSNQEFLQVANQQLVLVKADFPRAKKNRLPEALQRSNGQLAEQFNPNGDFPLVLMLDHELKPLFSWKGYTGNPEVFLNQLQLVLKGNN